MSKLADVLQGACDAFDEWLYEQDRFPSENEIDRIMQETIDLHTPERTSEILACACDRVALAEVFPESGIPVGVDHPPPLRPTTMIARNIADLIRDDLWEHWEKLKNKYDDECIEAADWECGSCGAFHRPGFAGDCRNGSESFGTEEAAVWAEWKAEADEKELAGRLKKAVNTLTDRLATEYENVGEIPIQPAELYDDVTALATEPFDSEPELGLAAVTVAATPQEKLSPIVAEVFAERWG
jgi:hypothetical protein